MKEQFSISSRFAVGIVVGVLLSLALSRLNAGETVVDTTIGFTLELPDGFAPDPARVGATPDIIHAFVLSDPTHTHQDILLLVEKLGGTIGRERLKPEDMPPGFRGRVFTTIWQGFEVDAFEIPESVGGITTVTYNAQIPLKREAIQIRVSGPEDRKSDLKRVLSEALKGLEGQSNWIPSVLPTSSFTSSENYGLILLAVAVVFVLGGLLALFLASWRLPKGAILALALGIYLASWGFEGVRVREFLMLKGAMRMLGFAGGILGVIDLIRKRKSRDQLPS